MLTILFGMAVVFGYNQREAVDVLSRVSGASTHTLWEMIGDFRSTGEVPDYSTANRGGGSKLHKFHSFLESPAVVAAIHRGIVTINNFTTCTTTKLTEFIEGETHIRLSSRRLFNRRC